MGRPKEHDERVRAALLVAAEQLVDEQGADGLSVRSVAEAVETTTRAVYSVFGSKAGLLEALAIRLFELLDEALDGIERSDDPAADLLHASLHGFRRVALEHAPLYRLVFLRVTPDVRLGPEFSHVASATLARLEALIDRWLISTSSPRTKGQLRNATRAFHALTEGLATMELRGALGDARAAERVWRDGVAALVRGLANQIGATRE